MKIIYVILVFILIIIFGMLYFSVFGIQTISTDKKVYSSGENIEIYWSDFSISWCSCSRKGIQIFKQGQTGWEMLPHQIYGFGGACIDGIILSLPMHCDAISCSFPKLNFRSNVFIWNSKFYERMPKSTLIALDEFENDQIYYRQSE